MPRGVRNVCACHCLQIRILLEVHFLTIPHLLGDIILETREHLTVDGVIIGHSNQQQSVTVPSLGNANETTSERVYETTTPVKRVVHEWQVFLTFYFVLSLLTVFRNIQNRLKIVTTLQYLRFRRNLIAS
jgi:hypothetical protein